MRRLVKTRPSNVQLLLSVQRNLTQLSLRVKLRSHYKNNSEIVYKIISSMSQNREVNFNVA